MAFSWSDPSQGKGQTAGQMTAAYRPNLENNAGLFAAIMRMNEEKLAQQQAAQQQAGSAIAGAIGKYQAAGSNEALARGMQNWQNDTNTGTPDDFAGISPADQVRYQQFADQQTAQDQTQAMQQQLRDTEQSHWQTGQDQAASQRQLDQQAADNDWQRQQANDKIENALKQAQTQKALAGEGMTATEQSNRLKMARENILAASGGTKEADLPAAMKSVDDFDSNPNPTKAHWYSPSPPTPPPQSEIDAVHQYRGLLTPPAAPGPIQQAPPSSSGQPDQFIVGKQYRDAKGNVATYQGNGNWQ